MATQLFFLDVDADTHRGTNSAPLAGGTTGWTCQALGTARGSGVITPTGTATVTGPTAGLEMDSRWAGAGWKNEWLSPPVSADVTISGTITANIWGRELNMTDNVAINVAIDIVRATDNSIVNIVNSTRTTEMAQSATTNSVNNFTTGMTSGAYAGQTVNRGDRLRIRIFGDDAGTMASGGTFRIGYNGTTAAADGDSYVSFAETFAFESAPGGTTLYLTDTASDVSTSSVDREAWTSRGSGVLDDVTNTAAGWTAPIQTTDTAAGTVVDWFTKQLQAFTLGGMAEVNIRAKNSAAGATSLKVEIARVDSDGTNPSIWGIWCTDVKDGPHNGQVGTSEAAYSHWVSGDDLAISDGQRLRIRVYVDDASTNALTNGQTVTTYYNGTSGGASGDSYVILPQSVSEFVAASLVLEQGYVNYQDPGVL